MRPILLAILLAQLPSLSRAQGGIAVDSIVLERTLCFGICPAYRLSLSEAGEVRFESRNPGDSNRTANDRIAAESVRSLAARALIIGFFQLPDTILGHPRLCADLATDHPTVTVTITTGGTPKRVVDYHGCFAASSHSLTDPLERLRALETAIDSVAGSARWVRPAARRR